MADSSAARARSKDPQSRRRQRSPPAARAAEDTDCPLERPRKQCGLSRLEQAEWDVADGATWPISREADRLKATRNSRVPEFANGISPFERHRRRTRSGSRDSR